MRDPKYRVNLRHISTKNQRTVRQLTRELRRAESPGDVADLSDKIDMIYRVAFATHGKAELAKTRAWIEAKYDADAYGRPMMEALIYSGDFATYREKAIKQLKDTPNDVPTRAAYVRAQLLMGEVALATDAAKTLLTDVTLDNGQTPQESRFMASHLVAVGEAAWLRRTFPLVASRTWQCRYSRHLKRPTRPGVKTFCINMDRDTTRLTRARAMLAPGVDFHRSPGVSGVAVPEVLLQQAGLEVTVARKAQVGCHLSHIRAWERIRDDVPEGEYGLVAEDDAHFTCGPGVGLHEAIECARTQGLDLLFINEEANYFMPLPTSVDDLAAVTVEDALASVGDNVQTGWGGEGYLLTPKGAAELIDMSMKFGILAGLDWQIALYAMTDLTGDALRHSKFGPAPQRIAAAREAEPGKYHIRGGVLNLALMTQNDLGYKTHNVEVSVARSK